MSEDQFGQVTVAGLPAGRGCIWSLAQVVSSPKFNVPLLNLILIFGVSVEECLDFQLVHPATQAASELSLDPKVKAAEPPSEEFKELFASLQKKVSDNMSQHSPNSPNAIAWQRNPALVWDRTIVGPVPHLPQADYIADRLSTLWIACLDHGNGPSLQASR
jgi:hypothetical protein